MNNQKQPKLTVEKVLRFLREELDKYNKYKNNKWQSSTMTCADVEYAWWDEEDGDNSWDQKNAMYQVRKQLKKAVVLGSVIVVDNARGRVGARYGLVTFINNMKSEG